MKVKLNGLWQSVEVAAIAQVRKGLEEPLSTTMGYTGAPVPLICTRTRSERGPPLAWMGRRTAPSAARQSGR